MQHGNTISLHNRSSLTQVANPSAIPEANKRLGALAMTAESTKTKSGFLL